jgi:hypothetical protein
MFHPPAERRRRAAVREVGTLLAAEDVALALFRLQERIDELKRENDFLRGRVPAADAAAPRPLTA